MGIIRTDFIRRIFPVGMFTVRILPVDEFAISHFIRCAFCFVLSNFERWPSVKYVTSHEAGGLRNSGISEVCDRGGEGVSGSVQDVTRSIVYGAAIIYIFT